MKFKRIIKYLLAIITITLTLLISGGVLVTWLYQDKIINLCVAEINKHLKTKIFADKISLSVFDKFPNVSISFNRIVIEGSNMEDARLPKLQRRQGKCLVKAKDIFCTFNIKDLISGNYVIDEIWLEDAKIFLRIDEDGNNNFTIFEPGITGASENKLFSFDLQKIYFKNVLFLFDNQQSKQAVHFLSTGTNAGLRYEGDLLNISLNGNLFLYKIQLNKSTWFSKKNISLECDLIYNKKNEILKINPSVLQVENSEFGIKGKWVGGRGTKDKQKIDYINLSIDGKKTTAQTILSLLPGDLYEKFSVYKSKGSVYFSGKIIGNISETATPAIDILFGFNNASFYLPLKATVGQAGMPDSKHSIKKVNLAGKFSNGKKHNQSSSSLTLSGIKAELDGKPLKGSFLIKNFDSPYISFNIDANIDIATLLAYYPNDRIDQADGTLKINMDLSGGLEQLKQINLSKNFNTSGEFSLRNFDLTLKNISLNFKNFNGNFLFNKNDIAATNFSGKIGSSDFLINGFFKNLLPYLLFEDQTLFMEADLRSDLLDLDELLATDYTDFLNERNGAQRTSGEGREYRLSVSPDLSFALGCNIGSVKFRRFRGKNITGKLIVVDQVVSSDNISFNVGGGKLNISGMINAKGRNEIAVTTKAGFEKIHIDSIFYIFENFNQDFITDKHLKGQISARAIVNMFFDSNLKVNYDKLIADIDASIANGQLVNFEPMRKLSKFLDEKRLADLKFSELRNSIHIEDRTIFFPEMEIRSNVSAISVMGAHGFDQSIDYKLKIPLKNYKIKDKVFGAIEEDEQGVATLYLTIKGTTDDYKITYDKERVKVRIRRSWQNEKEEFTDLFKRKPIEAVVPDTVTILDEEEYFDFEE
ncbi:MAG: DUF3971 domain-containing protein [Cytophagales bacterium]|nr:DUF3971 domain-containing protein [Cytophagales bacterium]